MELSRRGFVVGAAGAAALAAVRGTPAAPVADWGYSFDGGFYRTGYGSAPDAVAAAREHSALSSFSVARTTPVGYSAPSEAGEAVVDLLLNDRRPGFSLVEWVVCANEEGDYEGEFSDACHRAERVDPQALDVPARAAVAEALDRAGLPGVAAAYAAGGPAGELDDAVYDALASDAVLAARVGSLVDAFVHGKGLDRDLLGLRVEDVVDYPATERGPRVTETVAA